MVWIGYILIFVVIGVLAFVLVRQIIGLVQDIKKRKAKKLKEKESNNITIDKKED